MNRDLLRLAASELRAWSSHYGTSLERLIPPKHDKRMPDGGCVTCALLALLEEAIGEQT